MSLSTGTRRTWRVEEVRALGMTCDLTTAAHVLGIGRTLAFELVRTDAFPVRILRLGRAVRVPVADLLALLLGESQGPSPESD